MNERIEKLAVQAFLFASTADESDDSDESDANWWREYNEKFAELIVKECAEQCTTDGPFVAEVVWGKQFHKKILEHFGVK